MPVNFAYDAKWGNRVVIISVGEIFTDAELLDLNRRLYQEIYENAQEPIYQIMDGTRIKRLPPNMLLTSLQLYKQAHPKVALTVLVTANAFAHALLNALTQFRSVRSATIVCQTMAEAQAEVESRLHAEATARATPEPVFVNRTPNLSVDTYCPPNFN